MPCAPGTEFNAPRQICTSNNICPPEQIIKVPHSTDPGKYYDCVYGNAHLMSCPGTLVFDANLKLCTWPTRRRQLEKDGGKSETKNKMADDDDEEEKVEEEETNDVTDENLDEDLEDELMDRREKKDQKQRDIEELREALRKIWGGKNNM